MSLYENVFITRHELSQTQVETLTQHFIDLLEQQGGVVHKIEQWGMRNLAYVIKKKSKGYYTLLNIEAPSSAVQEMERQMRIHEDILRFLTIRVKELDPNPSPMMQELQEKKHTEDDAVQSKEYKEKDVVKEQHEEIQQTDETTELTVSPKEETPIQETSKEDTESL